IYNQSGGTVNVAPFNSFSGFQAFLIGEDQGSSGTYHLGNSGTFNANEDSYIGLYGNGTFNQSGSSIASFQSTAGTALYIAAQLGATGQYSLGGAATLHAYRQEEI